MALLEHALSQLSPLSPRLGVCAGTPIPPACGFGHLLREGEVPVFLLSVMRRIRRVGPGYRLTSLRKAIYVMRLNGTVKFFNTAKGFGFIQPDEGGKDVFVHATAVEAAGMRALNEGDRVSFELEDDRRGRGKQAGQLKRAQ
jgi:CspA family cold shock protein